MNQIIIHQDETMTVIGEPAHTLAYTENGKRALASFRESACKYLVIEEERPQQWIMRAAQSKYHSAMDYMTGSRILVMKGEPENEPLERAPELAKNRWTFDYQFTVRDRIDGMPGTFWCMLQNSPRSEHLMTGIQRAGFSGYGKIRIQWEDGDEQEMDAPEWFLESSLAQLTLFTFARAFMP